MLRGPELLAEYKNVFESLFEIEVSERDLLIYTYDENNGLGVTLAQPSETIQQSRLRALSGKLVARAKDVFPRRLTLGFSSTRPTFFSITDELDPHKAKINSRDENVSSLVTALQVKWEVANDDKRITFCRQYFETHLKFPYSSASMRDPSQMGVVHITYHLRGDNFLLVKISVMEDKTLKPSSTVKNAVLAWAETVGLNGNLKPQIQIKSSPNVDGLEEVWCYFSAEKLAVLDSAPRMDSRPAVVQPVSPLKEPVSTKHEPKHTAASEDEAKAASRGSSRVASALEYGVPASETESEIINNYFQSESKVYKDQGGNFHVYPREGSMFSISVTDYALMPKDSAESKSASLQPEQQQAEVKGRASGFTRPAPKVDKVRDEKQEGTEPVEASSNNSAIETQICTILENEMKSFLTRKKLTQNAPVPLPANLEGYKGSPRYRGKAKEFDADNARYEILSELNTAVKNTPKNADRAAYLTALEATINRVLDNAEKKSVLDKYHNKKMRRRIWNLLGFLFSPIKRYGPKCMPGAGTWFYSTSGKSKKAVDTALKKVRELKK